MELSGNQRRNATLGLSALTTPHEPWRRTAGEVGPLICPLSSLQPCAISHGAVRFPNLRHSLRIVLFALQFNKHDFERLVTDVFGQMLSSGGEHGLASFYRSIL
jgi:hypothetical protein